MQFRDFAERAAAVEATDADTEVVAAVADLFGVAGEDLPAVARFVQGRIFPAWSERKLDVGPAACNAAIARVAGPNVDADDVEAELADRGDVGDVAASYDLGAQADLSAFGDGSSASGDDADNDGERDGEGAADGLTVGDVADALAETAAAAGAGSEAEKETLLFGLFNRSSPVEARYLARLVLGEMRIGVGQGTVRDAVAAAFEVPAEAVERALQVSNDYGAVARTAREEGRAGLDAMGLEVGRPVQAMLAQAGTVADALEEFDHTAVETKYDGARVQIHHAGGEVSIHSRNMEDVTGALPEIADFVRQRLSAPAILDGEVVAVDEAGEPLPFQEVLRRLRRKHDVERMREEVAVELRAFDCLHADGEDLLDTPLLERRDRLTDLLAAGAGVGDLALSDDPDEIAAIERAALDAGHEGILLKDPDSTYSPGRRGRNWLKRKPAVETLDLVVIGAEWGEGRRANHFGTFRLAARTDDEGGFAPIGNVATGITDEKLAELTERLEPHVRAEEGQEIDFEPAVVFEVGYEEIQRSPSYGSGYALRFPRFVAVREDIDPADADTLERIERLADGDGNESENRNEGGNREQGIETETERTAGEEGG
jgi:DNA ligase-1